MIEKVTMGNKAQKARRSKLVMELVDVPLNKKLKSTLTIFIRLDRYSVMNYCMKKRSIEFHINWLLSHSYTLFILKIKVIGSITSRRPNSKRRKRKALPMLLIAVILE
jgi:hypothetical protein